MDDLEQYQKHREECDFKFAPLDVCNCTQKNMLARIAALEAQLAKADALAQALEWYRGNVSWCNNYGPEGTEARDRLAKDTGKRAETALTEYRAAREKAQ